MAVEAIVVGRDRADMKAYGIAGTAFVGKHLVGKGEDAYVTNPILMDVARPHVVLVLGKRGTGKSHSLGVIAEEIAKQPAEVRQNLSVVIIDPMGIYWSLKQPNSRNAELLAQWGMKPEGFPVKLFVPKGSMDEYKAVGIAPDAALTLAAGRLRPEDWLLTFGFDQMDPHGICLERAVKRCQAKLGGFGIAELAEAVAADAKSEQSVRDGVANRLSAAAEWGLFEKVGTPLEQLFAPGQITVVDVSHFGSGSGVQGLLVGLLSREVYQQRLIARKAEETEAITGLRKRSVPMVWLMLDEAHEFLPAKGATPASAPLLTLVRQGREPGISLLFVTQRPNKLHEDALAQADLVFAHPLTARADIQALRGIMQTYVLEDIQETISGLPKLKGAAIVLDDSSERIFGMQMRPRLSWHAGGSPSALRKKTLFS